MDINAQYYTATMTTRADLRSRGAGVPSSEFQSWNHNVRLLQYLYKKLFTGHYIFKRSEN
eukprot:scaffold30465_cov51-Attheya_sp.AAC.1